MIISTPNLKNLREQSMPFYVYAIHKDNTNNRLYGIFDNYREAAKMEREMHAPMTENYCVACFNAESDDKAELYADSLRPFPKRTK